MSNNLKQPSASPNDGPALGYLEEADAAHATLDDWVRTHPDGSPYHLRAWRAAVADAYGYRSKVLLAREGGAITGYLPVCIVTRPLRGAQWSALPFCDLGGPLADTRQSAAALLDRAVHDAASQGAGLEARCIDPHLAPEGRKVRMVLALPDSAEALMKSYAPKLRSQIRKAEKNGLSCAIEAGVPAVDAFYQVYSRNMRRLGSPPHSRRWFESVQQHYGRDMFIMVVRHDGKAIGAGLVLQCGHKAAIPWASTLAEYNTLAPNMLLYWKVQAHLCELGVRQFDFGRSTFGEGTYNFKKQWGALPLVLDWQEWDASGVRRPSLPTRASRLRPLIEQGWSRLPLSVTNKLGPRLRRYITL
jgi:FemAB-related protein (PEP-CTERM system-associated)